MDIVIRFGNNITNEVSTRYSTLAFLGRSRVIDLLEVFQDSTLQLTFNKLLQISMDGQYVNLTFFKDQQESLLV